MLALAQLHLHAMLVTPAFRVCLRAFRLILRGKALEQRFQPCQQALFVVSARSLAPCGQGEGDVDIGAGWRLWQCWDCLTLGLC